MYSRILVPVDGSPTAEAGLMEAVRLARLGNGALRLLHVLQDLPFAGESVAYGQWPSERTQAALDRGHELLRGLAERVTALGAKVDTLLVEAGGRPLEDEIQGQIAAWPADIVVMGTHGRRGAKRLLLGSDAEALLRICDVPVLLARHDGEAEHGQGTHGEVAVPQE